MGQARPSSQSCREKASHEKGRRQKGRCKGFLPRQESSQEDSCEEECSGEEARSQENSCQEASCPLAAGRQEVKYSFRIDNIQDNVHKLRVTLFLIRILPYPFVVNPL